MHNKLLTRYYFINKLDTNHINNQDKNTIIIYRNYNTEIQSESITKFKTCCNNKGFKFFLANNIKLALNLNLDGAYIPSFNKDTNHLSYSYKKNFLIIGSAHNNNQIRTKELQGAKIIFLSSLFKKNKNYLGINKFKILSKLTKKKIVALGGVSKNNLKKLKLINCDGFAGITFFKKKAPNRGPF
jgi:thiamine-phosphate pyrophosphorylase